MNSFFQKIYLLNLNTYLGGGEILAIRMAEYLKANSLSVVVVCSKNSYLHDECDKRDLEYLTWPTKNLSVLYMDKAEKKTVEDFWAQNVERDREIKSLVYTFCMRDVYNVSYLNHVCNSDYFISTGIYHPLEIYYSATKTIWTKLNKYINQKTIRQYRDNDAVIIMNEYSYLNTFRRNNEEIRKDLVIPLPIERQLAGINDDFEISEGKRIICIGRFVDFKYLSILNVIDFVRVNSEYTLTIVGYGLHEKKIRKAISGIEDRVKIVGKVSPDELGEMIKKHNIGYAMGTSVLECASLGIPTIIAASMYPTPINKLSRHDKCMGIFGDTSSFELGEVSSRDDYCSLIKSIDLIEKNYKEYSEKSKNHVQNYYIDTVMEKYIRLWNNMRFKGTELTTTFPRITCVRFLIKRLLIRLNSKYLKD